MHGRARPLHTGLDRLDRYELEVGQKNDKFFFRTGLPEVAGG